jgi:hypothetical protein
MLIRLCLGLFLLISRMFSSSSLVAAAVAAAL